MTDEIRTYRVCGTMRESVTGYASVTIDVKAFTAADALVQVKLEHDGRFNPRSIAPVEARHPDSIDADLGWAYVDNRSSQVSVCGHWCVGVHRGIWTLYRHEPGARMGGWVEHSEHGSEVEAKSSAANQQKGLE